MKLVIGRGNSRVVIDLSNCSKLLYEDGCIGYYIKSYAKNGIKKEGVKK